MLLKSKDFRDLNKQPLSFCVIPDQSLDYSAKFNKICINYRSTNLITGNRLTTD